MPLNYWQFCITNTNYFHWTKLKSRTIADSQQVVLDGLKEDVLLPDGHVVLDEAEELLALAYGDDVEDIWQQTDRDLRRAEFLTGGLK